jgi:hypothetical protein
MMSLQLLFGNMYEQYKYIHPRSMGDISFTASFKQILYFRSGNIIDAHEVGDKKVDKYIFNRIQNGSAVYTHSISKVEICLKPNIQNVSEVENDDDDCEYINKEETYKEISNRINDLNNLMQLLNSKRFIDQRNHTHNAKHFYNDISSAYNSLNTYKKSVSFMLVSNDEIDKVLTDDQKKITFKDKNENKTYRVFMYLINLMTTELKYQMEYLKTTKKNIEKLKNEPIIRGTFLEDYRKNDYFEYNQISKNILNTYNNFFNLKKL